jgi:hypothetical protein
MDVFKPFYFDFSGPFAVDKGENASKDGAKLPTSILKNKEREKSITINNCEFLTVSD